MTRQHRTAPKGTAVGVGAGAALLNNFIPEVGIQHIADFLIGWKENEKLSRTGELGELKSNDYNISSSRYLTNFDGDGFAMVSARAEVYRPIALVV